MMLKNTRNYDAEGRDTADHQYAYSFDFDIMHPYMIRSFMPFFRPGNLLELGSYKGNFTQQLLEHFDDITCVEASGEAIEEVRVVGGEGGREEAAPGGDKVVCGERTAVAARRGGRRAVGSGR